MTRMTTLRDTTLRSVVFGMKDVQMTPYTNKQVTLAQPVGSDKFNEYMWVLHTMAQLSRLVYSDSGIIREALLSAEFGQDNNTAVNNLITSLDKKYASQKRAISTYAGSIEGRPMQSYVLQEGKGTPFARYISSPSDVTFMFLNKSKLKAPFFQEGDVVLVFKGSSTVKNFKHDIYSQVKMPKDISDIFTTVPRNGIKNMVPPGFADPLSKNWHLVLQGIEDFKPRRLFITGHSLGGAYATMCAFVLGLDKKPGIESIHLVSFGCPTVVADGARNTFNTILDSGYMTLDRVVSSFGKVLDIIPAIPVGFSHPGFQPLRTELYPELKTGRAYNLDTIRKVYTGGFLFGEQKSKYAKATTMHIPTRMTIPTSTVAGRGFPHAEYFDMTFMGGFRLLGMKNPGFKVHTFIAELSDVGVYFKYVNSKPGEVSAGEADSTDVGDPKSGAPAAAAAAAGGRRKTRKVRDRGRHRATRRKM